ncbi:MAG TPA: alkaline phosphatase family protein [Casimicrobiaceae bacterium]|nr:alkaline phosphatase family protein [Casimicrobiaceae bacterium]
MPRVKNIATLLLSLVVACPTVAADRPHNVILFIPDGLRAMMVNDQTAPTMAAIRDNGVNFKNPHSLFPTFTMPNASAMATGHYLGDTGDFSNTIYSGFPVPGAGDSLTPFLESDPVLGDVDEHFAGDYLDEVTLLKAAREAGLSTATIGKLGPALIFDHTDRAGAPTIVIDDSTGSAAGIPLSPEVRAAIGSAELPFAAPPRGENGKAGNAITPGTKNANVTQQDYFVEITTKVVLPMFKARNRPFVLVFWSRDPDGTQHNQGDSLNQLVPGINGPTSLASIRNADDDLARIQKTLFELGLNDSTDIFVTADHGFATISKQSKTSAAAKQSYANVPPGYLPPGFVAIDLAKALGMPLYDPDAKNAAVATGTFPSRSNGLIGSDPANPDVVVAANGGSDLVYLPTHDKALAGRVVKALLVQDYVSGVFVDDSLGSFPGTLPLSAINLKGSAVTPIPAIAVNFRTFSTGCAQPLLCTVEVADTGLQQGQGMHGSFSRADTMNFMAAIGPDFKAGFADPAPASNADVGMTLARILGLDIPSKGKLIGRVLAEAMPGGATPKYVAKSMQSAPARGGLRTVLDYQVVGNTRYFDAAGFPGRTVGLTRSAPNSNQPETTAGR